MALDNKNTTNDSKFGSDGFDPANPNRGEKIDYDCNLEPNKFPREGGSDTAGEFANGDFSG